MGSEICATTPAGTALPSHAKDRDYDSGTLGKPPSHRPFWLGMKERARKEAMNWKTEPLRMAWHGALVPQPHPHESVFQSSVRGPELPGQLKHILPHEGQTAHPGSMMSLPLVSDPGEKSYVK